MNKTPPVTLHKVDDAPLPAVYIRARKLLAECDQLDECQSWADRAAALASYARQAKDDALLKHAMRIQSRAIQRAGELLEQIESGSQANLKQNRTEGDHRSETREDAWRAAGLSEHKAKQAVRVARVPKDEFDELVESDNPPTVTELARRGTKPAAPTDKDCNCDLSLVAAVFRGALRKMKSACEECDTEDVIEGMKPHEIEEALIDLDEVTLWVEAFREAAADHRA